MEASNTIEKIREQMDIAQKNAVEIERCLGEARGILQAYIRQNTNVYYTDFGEMVLEASKSSEQLTEKLRRLSLEVTLDVKKYEDYKSDLIQIHGIEITYQDEILKISMPVLVPHRKGNYTDYLYKPLHTAIQHWCVKQAEDNAVIPEYKSCTICFVHAYDQTLPLSRVRDHDNIEEKHILDILANFFLFTDGGLYVDTYHMTMLAPKDKTQIYVMDSSCFHMWVQKFKSF